MVIFLGKKWSFRISIASLMIGLTLTLSATFLLIAYRTFTRAADHSSERLFAEIADKLSEKVDSLLGAVESATEAGAFLIGAAPLSPDHEDRSTLLLFMLNGLKENQRLHAFFVEDRDGTLLRVLALRADPALHERYGAFPNVAYVVRTFDEKGRLRRQAHFDEQLQPVAIADPEVKVVAPLRPWAGENRVNQDTVCTAPYVFASEIMAGIACTRPASNGSPLFGTETTLGHFSDFLWGQQVSRFGTAFLFDLNGNLLAHPREPSFSVIHWGDHDEMWLVPLSQSQHPEVKAIWSRFKESGGRMLGRNQAFWAGDEHRIVRLSSIRHSGLQMMVAVTSPLADFTGDFALIRQRVLLVSALAAILAVLASFLIAGRVSRALSRLAASAERIQHFDFSDQPAIESVFIEIHSLANSFALMLQTVRQRTEALITTRNHLSFLVDKGIALAGEHQESRLTSLAFSSACELALADGGQFFRTSGQGRLSPVLVERSSRGIQITELAGEQSAAHSIDLEAAPDDPLFAAAREALVSGSIQSVGNYRGQGLTPGLADRFGPFAGALLVPLKTRRDKVIGLFLLVLPLEQSSDKTAEFDRGRYPFIEVLAAQAAIALDNQELIRAQRQLMDSFIKVIAGAIDAKSPHTGGHCSRVPELALLLAREADKASRGALADFHLQGDEAWREFEIAAWLHDCGKLTTPDILVNKATKLDAHVNRIHEIRMRFEILWRDLEIDYLRSLKDGEFNAEERREALEQQRRQLIADFQFIAGCNLGQHPLDEADRKRLLVIAGRTFAPQFDDRLGLSEEETGRLPARTEPGRPNPLLADRPDHLIPFGPANGVDMSRFNLRMPEYRFNHGELHNLMVEKGTLTAEERFGIQEHIVHTIRMLEQLPFPEHLARVPEYAGSHHEKCNGHGYPRGLTCAEMSVPARILAIADVFEALTAADRPYKPPMRVSEALGVMEAMAGRGEIDAELFALFAESGLISRYGHTWLRPEQMT